MTQLHRARSCSDDCRNPMAFLMVAVDCDSITPPRANLFATDGLDYEAVELTAFPSESRALEAGKYRSAPKEKSRLSSFIATSSCR